MVIVRKNAANAAADKAKVKKKPRNPWTLTIVSVKRPDRMLKVLREERQYKIVNTETSGIYHIVGDSRMPVILLVVSSELPIDGDDRCLIWLRSLRNDLTSEEAVELAKIAEINDNEYLYIWEEVEEMTANAKKVREFYMRVAVKSGLADELAEKQAIAMAQNMFANKELTEKFKGDDKGLVNMIVNCSGLDLNTVLKIKGGDL